MDSTLKPPDGLSLAYAEYGDPQGKPFFFFHGMPGSRLFRPPAEVSLKSGVRLITIAKEEETGSRRAAAEEQISRPEVRKAYLQSEVEAFRPGLRGLAWEARLFTRPCGFNLEEIRVLVHLWQGTDDCTTSIARGRAVTARIPNCRATFSPGEGHLLLFPHREEILVTVATY